MHSKYNAWKFPGEHRIKNLSM